MENNKLVQGGKTKSEKENKSEKEHSNWIPFNIFFFFKFFFQKIRSPSPGFEDVIHNHFYLQKDRIMNECHEWYNAAHDKPKMLRVSRFVFLSFFFPFLVRKKIKKEQTKKEGRKKKMKRKERVRN